MNSLEINENLRRSVLFGTAWVRRFVKNSVSGLYSEEMRSSRVRAVEWRSQFSLHVKSKATTTYFCELMESSRDDFKQQ